MTVRNLMRWRFLAAATMFSAACVSPVSPPTAAAPTAATSPATDSPGTASPTALPTAPPASASPTSRGFPAVTPATVTPSPPTTTPGAGIDVREADIAAHLDALAAIAAEHDGNRASGTSGYEASVDYVAGELEAIGYAVTRQPVDFTFFREAAPVSLSVGGQSWTGIEWLHAMVYSAGGDVTGSLQAIGIEDGAPSETAGCDAADWSTLSPGNIAIVFGGPCLRRDVVSLAQDAGAGAVITMYPTWGVNQTRQPTLLDPAGIDIPALAVGREPALALLGAVESGGQARLSVEVEMSAATAENVIGELPGSNESVVMLGGHLDSVLDGPGLNDNGSGAATLLAVAAAVARAAPPSDTVRFAFWAIEELGTHGSNHYVESLGAAEIERIEAYINLDMVGSTNAGRYVYEDEFAAQGSSDITRRLLDAFATQGAAATTIPSGGSDHLAFQRAGIATGGLFSGIAPLSDEEAELYGGEAGVAADQCYHLACDDRNNVDTATALLFGQAVAAVVGALAY